VANSRLSKQRPRTGQRRAELYADALAVLEAEFGSDLHLDEVAGRIAPPGRQLQPVFCEVGNTTFWQQREAMRVDRARYGIAASRYRAHEKTSS
jgi:AraC family transcriptional regulator of adaptative response / methylphosphotriester-DNA alkyltransferase methyltransferase